MHIFERWIWERSVHVHIFHVYYIEMNFSDVLSEFVRFVGSVFLCRKVQSPWKMS